MEPQFRFLNTLPVAVGATTALFVVAAAATFLAAVVAVLLMPAPALLGFGLRVLTVELLTTTFPFVFAAVVVVVVFFIGALDSTAVFFVPTALVDFVMTVPLEDVVLWAEALLRMLACDVVR